MLRPAAGGEVRYDSKCRRFTTIIANILRKVKHAIKGSMYSNEWIEHERKSLRQSAPRIYIIQQHNYSI